MDDDIESVFEIVGGCIVNPHNLDWCKKQASGISQMHYTQEVALAYIAKARKTVSLISSDEEEWIVIKSYYACYHALYAIVVKCGIKCEIHDCTIKLMDILGFSRDDREFMKNLKKDRVSVQYYLRMRTGDIQRVKRFLQTCEHIFDTIQVKDVIEEVFEK
ncbi:MAG: hypothetical protein ACMXYC_02395 [Candidatus Woesearchaeota archaeon]